MAYNALKLWNIQQLGEFMRGSGLSCYGLFCLAWSSGRISLSIITYNIMEKEKLGEAQKGFQALQAGMDNYYKGLKNFVARDGTDIPKSKWGTKQGNWQKVHPLDR